MEVDASGFSPPHEARALEDEAEAVRREMD